MKVLKKIPQVLVLLFIAVFALASCSTNISDTAQTTSRDALKISVVQTDINSSRAASTPYTVEIVISQSGSTLAKKSKDIAREGASFEFTKLPYDVELKIELSIYVANNKIAYGSTNYIIVPNAENLVTIRVATQNISTANLTSSDVDKLSALMEFSNRDITFCFKDKPNITNFINSLKNYERTAGVNYVWNIDFTTAGAIKLDATELKTIQVAMQNPGLPISQITIASGSTIELNSDDNQAIQKLNGSNVNVNWVQPACKDQDYTNAMNCLAISGLTNVHLNLSSIQINNEDKVKTVPTLDSQNAPKNVTSVDLTGIEKINKNAFSAWTGLTNVYVPASVVYLGINCFGSQTNYTIEDDGKKWKYNNQGQTFDQTIANIKNSLNKAYFTKQGY